MQNGRCHKKVILRTCYIFLLRVRLIVQLHSYSCPQFTGELPDGLHNVGTDMTYVICESLAETTGNVISLYVYQPVIYVAFCVSAGCLQRRNRNSLMGYSACIVNRFLLVVPKFLMISDGREVLQSCGHWQ